MAKMSIHEARELLQKIETRYKVVSKKNEVFRLYVLDIMRQQTASCVRAGSVTDEAAGYFKIAKHWMDELTPKNYEANLELLGTAIKLRSAAWPITDCNKKARLNIERYRIELLDQYAGLVA